jgi:hypothetical protein
LDLLVFVLVFGIKEVSETKLDHYMNLATNICRLYVISVQQVLQQVTYACT